MSEPITQQHPYLEQHQNAIQDVEKAHVMALAADKYETEAITKRQKVAEDLAMIGMPPTTPIEIGFKTAYKDKFDVDSFRLGQAKRGAEMAVKDQSIGNSVAEHAGRQYDEIQKLLPSSSERR